MDVGIVELTHMIDGKRKLSQYGIDFVGNLGNGKVYNPASHGSGLRR